MISKKICIGWEPEISLEDGLSETIEFVKKNIDLLKQIHIQSKMQAIILAGEKEQRCKLPHTANLPKPLMPMGEMPILEIIVMQLKNAGASSG